MEISEGENAPRNHAGSGDEGSAPPEAGDDAQAAKATNGARSPSSSTAREEGTPAADNNRRRSGRVVRPPRKLADELPMQSAPAKRKRAVVEQAEEGEEMADASGADNESNGDEEEDDGEGGEDESSEGGEEEEEEEEEPDEEELREKRKAAKKRGLAKKAAPLRPKAPAVKKARTASGAVAVLAKRAKKHTGANGAGPKSAAGRRGKGKQRVKERPAGEGGGADSILFGVLSSIRSLGRWLIGYLDAVMDADNLRSVANDWAIKYQEDGPEAMKQLVNFFLRVSGSTRIPMAVTNTILSAVDVSSLLQVMILKTKIPPQPHFHRSKKFFKRFYRYPKSLTPMLTLSRHNHPTTH